MTRWRVVRAPDGKYAVMSNALRGPVVGARDGLSGWEIVPGAQWQTFEEACLEAATHNGKPSTANMGRGDWPRCPSCESSCLSWSRRVFTEWDGEFPIHTPSGVRLWRCEDCGNEWEDNGKLSTANMGPQSAAERAGAT